MSRKTTVVDRYVNQSSKSLGGRASFFLASARASLGYHNARVLLSLDDRPAEEHVVYNVAVSNGCYFGGGMHVAPNAALDDGLFDVVTIGDVGMTTILWHASKIYRGTHLALPFVTVERARRVHAESVDGEASGQFQPLRLRARSTRNTGVPITAVSTPSGSSIVPSVRATVSTSRR